MKYPNLTAELMQNLAAVYASEGSAAFAEFTQGELKVLNYLTAHEGEDVLPSTLSTELSLTSARIAATLNTLEKKGYVIRSASPQDKRKILVRVTEEGREYVDTKRKKIGKTLSRLIQGIGKKDTKELNRILSRIIELDEKEAAQ